MRHNGGHAARRDQDRPGGGSPTAGPGGTVTNEVIAWAGFAGAWLLVAGPIYQAAIELAAEDIERDEIQAASDSVAAPARPSGWWWLIPPVGYLLWLRGRREHRRTVMGALTPGQMEQLVRFGNKATAWIYISGGAFLVALAETWTLREVYRWPIGVYVIVVVAMLAACAANTAVRLKRTRDMVPEAAWPPGKRRADESQPGGSQPGGSQPGGSQPGGSQPDGGS
jgi:hypothetical protein